MNIIQLTENKKQYLDLLLLADEQESMIDRYLERGELFMLDDHGVKGICVVTEEKEGVCELKNIAVAPASQRQGYGRILINYLVSHYSGKYFFTDNYDHQMIEDGVLLKDMVYLKRKIHCVKDTILPMQREQFEARGRCLDEQCRRYGNYA